MDRGASYNRNSLRQIAEFVNDSEMVAKWKRVLKDIKEPESQTPVSNDEIEKRKRMIARLEQIGENPTRVTDNEYENTYKLEAIALIAEDKDVPEELMKKIEEFERLREGKE